MSNNLFTHNVLRSSNELSDPSIKQNKRFVSTRKFRPYRVTFREWRIRSNVSPTLYPSLEAWGGDSVWAKSSVDVLVRVLPRACHCFESSRAKVLSYSFSIVLADRHSETMVLSGRSNGGINAALWRYVLVERASHRFQNG